MRIAICDNQVECLNHTASAVQKCIRGMDAHIDLFKSGTPLLQTFRKKPYDLVILDIEMPEIQGIQLAKALRTLSKDVPIIFLTSHIEYALDNAIYACEQLVQEERFITMTVKSTAQFWLVSMENPTKEQVDTNLLFRKSGGFTSKSDTKEHGIGTYNMKRVVEHYGGDLKATCHDSLFKLEIVIDKSATQSN